MYNVDYVEFPSTSASVSGEFFEKAFGWSATAFGPDYTGVEGAGPMFGFQSDAAEKTSAPLVIVRTDDLDATEKSVIDAGGVITTQQFEFPGGRRFHFREPGGCELAVWRSNE